MGIVAPRAKPELRHRFQRMLLIFLATYVTAAVAVALLQRWFIYHPTVLGTNALNVWAGSQGLERWRNPAGQAIGWKRLSRTQPAQGRVLITHGNAGCAVHRSHYVDALQQAAALDVFILEYPGYGDRPGSPNEQSLFAAAAEAIQLFGTNGPVYLLGESLGTGVTAYLAGTQPAHIAGLLLVAPYNNMTEVARSRMPIFPVRWMLRDRYRADEYLQHYRGPVGVLLAGRDELVPNASGRRLYAGYAGPKRLWETPEATHNDLADQPATFWMEVVSFWQSPAKPTTRH
jgi:pimeloyl-ACP methyl ester carboxylesterase